MKTQIVCLFALACASQRRQRVRAAHLRGLAAGSRAPPDSRSGPAARLRRARRTPPSRRPGRAPRCRARRCRRTGRARARRRASPSIANSASLTRSEVGLVTLPRGACKRLPPRRPAITRMPRTVTAAGTAPGAQAGIGSSACSPTASCRTVASSACSGACSSGSRGEDRLGAGAARARAAARPRAAAPRGTDRCPTGGCRSARPPCAARGRSRPGGSRRDAARARAAGPSRRSGAPPSRKHVERCSPRPTRPRSWCSCEMPKRSAFSISITVALGTSMPTSITVVATSTSACPEANAAIASCFSRGRMPPCSSASS